MVNQRLVTPMHIRLLERPIGAPYSPPNTEGRARRAVSQLSIDARRGLDRALDPGLDRCRDPCHDRHDPYRESRGPGRGPSDGHVETDRDLLPSTRHRTAFHHDEASPTEPLGTGDESNNPRATCIGFHWDTNSRRSR
jgi:hypothetical protein